MWGSVREAAAEPRIFAPAMDMRPSPAIAEVRSGDGIVFLDLYADEYSCRYEPERRIGDFRQQATIDEASACPLPRIDWAQSAPRRCARLSLRDVKRFGQALIRSIWGFRGRTLLELSRAVHALRTPPEDRSLAARDVADRFEQMLLWLPRKPECLFGSYFLFHFLALYGFRADWVFGVQLFPFRAHCWVAIEDELLNESPHAIENYHIIWVSSPPTR